jgi:arylesterase / paraoxonase
MKAAKIALPLVVLIFFGKLLFDAGLFHHVSSHGFEGCTPLPANIPGPEDMVFSPALQQVLASSDLRPDKDDTAEPPPGKIFGIDANGKAEAISEGAPAGFHPHGVDLLAMPGKDRLFVVSHKSRWESSVELFETDHGRLRHLKTFADPTLLTPNDVLAIGPESFYVTQDHGSPSPLEQNFEHFTRIPRGSLGYFVEGKFTTLIHGIGFANGIARDPGRSLLYIAATTEKAVRVYRIGARPEDLTYLSSILLPAGPDNLSLASDGALWIGAHPNLFALKQHSEHHEKRAPSLVLRVDQPWTESPKVTEVMENDGQPTSAVSVALPQGGRLYLGAIYDAKILVCPMPQTY